jgi:Cu(I)/Ag(I) efflux system periplasmic protein CusF
MMSFSKVFASVSIAAATIVAGTAIAATPQTTNVAVAPAAALTTGEIKKIDAEQGKVTIKHEAIQNLDMPAMTMVFRATNPELLKKAQVGDKIQFRAENVAGAFVVTDIQPGK